MLLRSWPRTEHSVSRFRLKRLCRSGQDGCLQGEAHGYFRHIAGMYHPALQQSTSYNQKLLCCGIIFTFPEPLPSSCTRPQKNGWCLHNGWLFHSLCSLLPPSPQRLHFEKCLTGPPFCTIAGSSLSALQLTLTSTLQGNAPLLFLICNVSWLLGISSNTCTYVSGASAGIFCCWRLTWRTELNRGPFLCLFHTSGREIWGHRYQSVTSTSHSGPVFLQRNSSVGSISFLSSQGMSVCPAPRKTSIWVMAQHWCLAVD